MTATQEGFYIGINNKALARLTSKVESPKEKVLSDLKAPCFQDGKDK